MIPFIAAAQDKNNIFVSINKMLNECWAQNTIVFLVLAMFAYWLYSASRKEYWRSAWHQLRKNKLAMISLAFLTFYFGIAMMDSIVWRDWALDDKGEIRRDEKGEKIKSPRQLSILDRVDRMWTRFGYYEKAWEGDKHYVAGHEEGMSAMYSAPFARETLDKISQVEDGEVKRVSVELQRPKLKRKDVLIPFHIFGTDKTGNDVFWQAVKGIRTGVILGLMTTFIIIPFAVFFGLVAGYFGKRIDDVIQYVYTTLASIPSVLIMVAFLMLTDQKTLFQLCFIMGVLNWTGLCRLLRGETLKLREMEYVQAARAFGVGHMKIIWKHILPNVAHLVIISIVLRFSGLVLSEAVLAYIGVGLDSSASSWGNMINSARTEMGRDPIVWWNLAASFIFMLGLVLPANLFGDALRDALDPRLRTV